jgi:hypothetical protein
VTEEEAADIETVGDAVDFVCARVRQPEEAGRPDPMTPAPPRWRSCSRRP